MSEFKIMEQNIQCIGVIMDGNRRWARAHNLPVFEGHSEGYKKLEEFLGWAREEHIPHVVAYAFSTENWQRAEDEVGYLLKLFRFVIEHKVEKMITEKIRVRFVGDRAHFPEDIQKGMVRVEEMTARSYETTLHLAVSYGGRAEILAATNALLAQGVSSVDSVDEETFSKLLWTGDMPDPDIIIRTGGEKRLSGFLPWQSVYSELFFVDSWWPDFSREDFQSVLTEFYGRERRRGK